MPELLTGTVTFLFSDIEGSTRLLRAQGDAWPAMLERHHEIMRVAFRAHGGEEAGTEGDSFFVGFPTAPGAVAAAVDAQRALAAEAWPPGAEIRVRIGMHTGEASFSAKSYAGLHVHRASRIAGVGHGGQVLISDSTRSLVGRDLPDGVDLRDLGSHRLKDLDHAERLWQLVIDGLSTEFPPIASLDATPNNLPTRLTSFLGREGEIEDITGLIGRSRLLTLTGPGGTGKTRLSLEVARRALKSQPGGVFFIELAPISQPELVLATIAQSLGLPDRGGRSSMDALVDHVGERRMLLVLDNFEQVIAAGAAVAELLARAPNLTVLVSSRSVLRVTGEQEYLVPPLGLPDLSQMPALTQLSEYEAVALFIERARAVKPEFVVTNENAPAVAEICVRLDGLPLAIELAAARIRILSPQAMLGRLEHRLGLLAGGARDLPERQQTLRGAIAWSHDMLDDTDRALFAGLAVFVGGGGLDAIERVCGGEMSGELLDTLTSLVEKSLVRQMEAADGEPRFEMLETIREFAMEQAIERGRWPDLRTAHATLFSELAERGAANIMGSDKRVWLDRLEDDHDNLRAAIAWAIETGDAKTAMRIGAALWRFWQMRGYLAEGLERVERALAIPGAADHMETQAGAFAAAAGIAYWQGDELRSRALYEQEISVRRALDDRRGLAEALYSVSFTYSVIGTVDDADIQAALRHVTEALEMYRSLGDEAGVGRCEWALANASYTMGDVEQAREHAVHALDVFAAVDDQFMVGWASYTLALTDLTDDYRAGGLPSARSSARSAARGRLSEALRIFAEAQDVSGYTLVLDALAVLALRDGQPERAARLAGAVAMLERTSGTGLNPWNRDVLGFDPEGLRDSQDPSVAAAYADGEAMSAADAVAVALAE